MPVFDPHEIVNLNNYQKSGMFHPFTCPNRQDGNHRNIFGDKGALVATVDGWICPFCNYTQNWAYEFMKNYKEIENKEPSELLEQGQRYLDKKEKEIIEKARKKSGKIIED